ncbi:hypothetical protein Nepgr_025885 [Nepenthes gracilis]|uniref:RNase H type-1 domain-containing protein n=1 Tax=Nepenthes gracilis TaxID=150966 RepID=A0AAD3XZX0_NEPGR|nr:hypothetical protein Nepgr_025885 [Nepenthes gracilis]
MEVPEWILYVDRSSTDTGNRAGVVLTSPGGFEVKYSIRLDFLAINNVAKYEALLAGVNGNFEESNPHMAKYLTRAREAAHNFDKLTLVHVPKTENLKAD